MGSIYSRATWVERLASAGWPLPTAPPPGGAYRPARVGADVVFTAGQLPKRDGVLAYRGCIGDELSITDACAAAELAALNGLAALAAVTDGFAQIGDVLQMRGFLRAPTTFEEHARVMDAASALVGTAFPAGHARTAVGVASLPGGAPIEIELVASIERRKTSRQGVRP